MLDVTLGVAFTAGVVSFLAPCVAPLVPAFLAYLAGTAIDGKEADKKAIFLNSVFFVLGFSAVFSLLGVILNSFLDSVAYDAQIWLSRVGGAFIIFFGLYLAGLIKISSLEQERKLVVKHHFSSRYLTSFVFGAAFAAGWTPCVGAVLGGVLGLAASQPGFAFALLFSYSMGLGLPFLLVGFFTSGAAKFINRYAYAFHYINIIFGIVLIALGILVFTQNLSLIANFEILNSLLLKL